MSEEIISSLFFCGAIIFILFYFIYIYNFVINMMEKKLKNVWNL